MQIQPAGEPATPGDGAAEPVEVVVVRLGADRVALALDAVGEVGRPPGLTRVPGLPGWVGGLANWRGRVLAVLNLSGLLSPAAAGSPCPRGRLVVLRQGGIRVGLLVDAVDGTRVLDLALLEPPLAHLPAEAAELLSGQLTDAEGPLGLLDVSAVLGLADRLPRPRRAG